MPEPGPDVDLDPGPGLGAGATPGPAEAPSGRQRLLDAVRRPARSQLVVAVLLALVGFAAITQVRTTEVDDTYAGLREQDLIDVLNGLAGTTQRTESEIARLEATRDDLRSDSSKVQTAIDEAQTEAETLSILAGLVPVTGPGIRVTITETDTPVRIENVLDAIQELRTIGAEAMQLNGQVRIVAQSSFAEGEGGLLVDGELLGPPYVLDVIGEPHTLAGAITFARGPRDAFEKDGAEVEITELQSLDIESVREPTQPEYAQPDLG